jgi:uncharacterized protein (TIGR02099 family)
LANSPKGNVEKLRLNWQGTASALKNYSAKGRLSQLEVMAVSPMPGVKGLNLDFELDQNSGQVAIDLNNGSVDLPEVFQESRIDFAKLTALARWQIKEEHITVQVSNIDIANADAQGTAQIKWESADPSKSANHSRYPGILSLQADLTHVEGNRVYRYLPLPIDQRARDYVHNAITAGQASNVRFDIRGDIAQMPAVYPHQGIFKISANVQNAGMAFVPRNLQSAQDLPWPALTDLSGKLLFNGMQLQVKDARAHLDRSPAVQVLQADVTIADLRETVVKVNALFKGPLKDELRVVSESPIGGLIGDALAHSTGTGLAEVKVDLDLPIAHLNQSKVQGRIDFSGNDLQVTPSTPKLQRTRGQLGFNQASLNLNGVQARMLGGDVRLDGGLTFTKEASSVSTLTNVIRASGTASAEGLRQATELGLVTRLARFVSGTTAYTANLGVRRGQVEWMVQSNLQGLASSLPAPLEKAADLPMALRIQSQLTEMSNQGNGSASVTERFSMRLGNLGTAMYERDMSSGQTTVLRGAIELGPIQTQAMMLPVSGVSANIQLPVIDVNAWQDVIALNSENGTADGSTTLTDIGVMAYLPTSLALQANTLTFGGHQAHQVVLGGRREDATWQANLAAKELNGYIEYRQGVDRAGTTTPGLLYARLAKLTLGTGEAPKVEALLDAQPRSIPALDVIVDEFETHGKSFGRLEVEAINRMAIGGAEGVPEWRLNKFNLSVPEATLTSSGNWTRLNAQGEQPSKERAKTLETRRTVLNFKLDVANGGALLTRLGMKDIVRQGKGKFEGQVSWLGSPLKINYPTLSGAFTVNVTEGQFLKSDPGIAKLFGVLSLQALPRRLTLDFRDVFDAGFAFDFFRGDVKVDHGLAYTNNLQMKGVNAAVLMEGQADIARETQDLKVVVVPEINAGTASLIATVINPAVGLGSFLAQMFLRRPLIASNTKELHVTGSWSDPQVEEMSRTTDSTKEKKP